MTIVGLVDSLRISGSGLTAERVRMDTIANNLANANTTRTEQGGPYRRQMVLFSAVESDRRQKFRVGGGVRVLGIVEDPTAPRLVYDPQHPDADSEGYVQMPNVNVITEMVDLISATRAYEANITAINAAKAIAMKALDIGRG